MDYFFPFFVLFNYFVTPRIFQILSLFLIPFITSIHSSTISPRFPIPSSTPLLVLVHQVVTSIGKFYYLFAFLVVFHHIVTFHLKFSPPFPISPTFPARRYILPQFSISGTYFQDFYTHFSHFSYSSITSSHFQDYFTAFPYLSYSLMTSANFPNDYTTFSHFSYSTINNVVAIIGLFYFIFFPQSRHQISWTITPAFPFPRTLSSHRLISSKVFTIFFYFF